MQNNVRMAVGAIIGWKNHEGHVILVKKVKTEDLGKADIPPEWDIPKGGMKPGEGAEEALWRELHEEVGGAHFKLLRRLPFSMDFALPPNSAWERQKTTLFLVEYDGDVGDLKPNSDEIAEAKLVRIEEAKHLVRYETTVHAIEEAKQFGLV